MNESPPPPPAGVTVREWFAGLALMNGELMKDLSIAECAAEAVRLADELVKALAVARMPSEESVAAPSEAEMVKWDTHIAKKRSALEAQRRDTVPGGRKKTAAYDFSATGSGSGMLPPPPMTATASSATAHFRRASDMLHRPLPSTKRFSPIVGRYSMVEPSDGQDE